MLHVRDMLREDFEFAVSITDTMNWGLVEEDFEFMLKLEPEGCFMVLDDSKKIGLITSISYGKIGWFGNLIVDEIHRRKGAGTLLVQHSIDYLRDKGAETVGLYAYLDKIPFYKKLGFEDDAEFAVLKGEGLSSSANANVRRTRKEEIRKLLNYDKSCFGSSREKLLTSILRNPNNLCFSSFEGEETLGYVAAKVYEGIAEIGPLVCKKKRENIAVALLKTILSKLKGFEVTMCVPQKETAVLDPLMKNGFSESFRVARMFLGIPFVDNCTYIAESLERG